MNRISVPIAVLVGAALISLSIYFSSFTQRYTIAMTGGILLLDQSTGDVYKPTQVENGRYEWTKFMSHR